MARIVVIGAGVVALGAAMLLAADGHEVIAVERDEAGPPEDPAGAWEGWHRPGVNQFRLPHAFLARFRAVLDAEFPAVARALSDAGALRLNFVGDVMPAERTGGWRDGDERFGWLTGRRPVMEAVVAHAAQATPGVQVRRGTAVDGLVTGTAAVTGVPHVTGVRTRAGEVIGADLVVDMSGRRSALPDWLKAAGARRPAEELEESGFIYYGRHLRSADGSRPAMIAPAQINWGTISSLTLPADNGTWAVALVTGSTDTALRGLREPAAWEAVVRSLPLIAHWLDGTPIDDGVGVMARLEDRHRAFVIEGAPVATGVVAVADSWACSNPTNGRGASIGILHALTLRDTLRTAGLDHPAAFAAAFHAATARDVEPWYRATLATDRHRVAEIEAGMRGERYDPPDPEFQLDRALDAAAGADPDCLRAYLDIRFVLRTPDQALASQDLRGRALELGADWRDRPRLGPGRDELVALASGAST